VRALRKLARYRDPDSVEGVAATIRVALAKGPEMASSFLTSARQAAHDVHYAKARHELWLARAEQRLASARVRHARDVAKAKAIEAGAWRELLAIPGMTVDTAAVVLDVPVGEVSRWARGSSRRPAPSQVSVLNESGGV
jgi:hypothetical protein